MDIIQQWIDNCNKKMIESGYGPKYIADQAGMSESTVRHNLSGRAKDPSLLSAGKISAVLHVSLDMFFGIDIKADERLKKMLEELNQERKNANIVYNEHLEKIDMLRAENETLTIKNELLRDRVKSYRYIFGGLFLVIFVLLGYCIYLDVSHPAIGFFRA